MTPYWTALFAAVAGIFTLAFKWRESFDRLNRVLTLASGASTLLLIGFGVGEAYGRSGDKSLDTVITTASWTGSILLWACIIAGWLAPKRND